MRIIQNLPQLENLGIHNPNRIYWQLNTPQLYEEVISRKEGVVGHLGPLVVRTGNHVSRAHNDRYIVDEPPFNEDVSWGELNRPINVDRFDRLLARMTGFFQGLDVYVQDVYARTSQDDRLPVRVVSETAWHSLFARNSFVYCKPEDLNNFRPAFTIIHSPTFRANPKSDGTNSETFVIINLSRGLILIGGTGYAGEIKKAIFSVINYLLPRNSILSMECAANMDKQGRSALFLGMYGTGKTTLATNPERILVGDSEHGWDDKGVFSIGRGCYATTFGLTREKDAEIYETTRRFGTILENVAVDVVNRQIDLNNDVFTKNTRACYPISHISYATRDGVAGHPKHIILLTMDAFGVLPPVSKLTPDQAHYHFLNGYTSELVETRYGSVEPQARFSACYGAPFMPLHPGHYASLFRQKVEEHNVNVWLVNTGWIGGAYDTGKRIPVDQSRAIIHAILNDELRDAVMVQEPYFSFNIPTAVSSLKAFDLVPYETWSDKSAYANQAQELVKDFQNNFEQYVDNVDPQRLAVQPHHG